MSNTWSYELRFPPTRAFSLHDFLDVLRFAGTYGFSTHNPVTNKISIFNNDDLDNVDVDAIEEAVILLEQHGGGIQLWRGDVDIDMHFSSSRHISRASTLNHSYAGPVETQLGFSIDNAWYHKENADIDVVMVMQQLFIDLCGHVHAPYGYAIDEYSWEMLPRSNRVYRDVQEQQLPLVLYWLNYVSDSYASVLDLEEIPKLGGKIRIARGGMLFSFFDYPWDVDAHALLRINESWRKVNNTR